MQIFHGEDQIGSRTAYHAAKNSVRSKGLQILEFAGDSLTLADLKSAFDSFDLFGQKCAVFVEGFFTRRPSNEKRSIIEYLASNTAEHLYFWEPKDVLTHIKNLPFSSARQFSFPKHIFIFLNNLSLNSYRKCLEIMPPEQIFASLATRLHKVLMGQSKFNLPISQTHLIAMNLELLNLDYRQKTSASPFDLASALEVWLLKIHNEMARK